MEWPRIGGFGKTTPQGVTMKIKYLAVLLAAAACLAGCSGFWNAPASSGTTTNTTPTTTTTLSSGYFYVLDKTTAQVISYYIDAGTLTPVGSAVAVPETPIAIAVAPNDDFLYVSTLNGIYLYKISSGVLTLGNSSQAIYGDPAVAMQVDATDSWLVETSGTGALNAVPIESTNGDLNSSSRTCSNSSVVCSVTLTGANINQLVIAPNNKYVFVAAATDGTEAFGFNAGNSDPFGSASGPYATEGPITSTTGSALSVAVDPNNSLLYIGEEGAISGTGGGLRVFTIGTGGTLSEVSGSPFASGGTGSYAVLPRSTANADYVYVASWNGTSTGTITGFSVAATSTSYSLTKLSSTASTGVYPMSLVEDSKDNFVLAESKGGNPYLDYYIFDTTTAGQLDLINTSSSYAGIALAANQ
jgi:6-phosphogluconolactonase (cycloisomerase 2 family)